MASCVLSISKVFSDAEQLALTQGAKPCLRSRMAELLNMDCYGRKNRTKVDENQEVARKQRFDEKYLKNRR